MTAVASPPTSTDSRPARGRRAPRVSGDERERSILETAERLLEDRSFHEISIDDLARGAGISRPTFYFYFPSKEAVLLTLVDRMVEEARTGQGDALERFSEDPAYWMRQSVTAIYETFRSHRAVVVAAADMRSTSEEGRELWARVMEQWIQETTAAIEMERARGAAPDGLPARDLAVALNLMNERVLLATLAEHEPALDEEKAIDVLVDVWLRAIYGNAEPTRA
jgi:TetR/AcrR family transcriptional regulator, ethionamide resistance regulator